MTIHCRLDDLPVEAGDAEACQVGSNMLLPSVGLLWMDIMKPKTKKFLLLNVQIDYDPP